MTQINQSIGRMWYRPSKAAKEHSVLPVRSISSAPRTTARRKISVEIMIVASAMPTYGPTAVADGGPEGDGADGGAGSAGARGTGGAPESVSDGRLVGRPGTGEGGAKHASLSGNVPLNPLPQRLGDANCAAMGKSSPTSKATAVLQKQPAAEKLENAAQQAAVGDGSVQSPKINVACEKHHWALMSYSALVARSPAVSSATSVTDMTTLRWPALCSESWRPEQPGSKGVEARTHPEASEKPTLHWPVLFPAARAPPPGCTSTQSGAEATPQRSSSCTVAEGMRRR